MSDAQLNVKGTLYFEKLRTANIKEEKLLIFCRNNIVRKYEFIKRDTETSVKGTAK